MKKEKKITALGRIMARQHLDLSTSVLVSFSLKQLIDLDYEPNTTQSKEPIIKFQKLNAKFTKTSMADESILKASAKKKWK